MVCNNMKSCDPVSVKSLGLPGILEAIGRPVPVIAHDEIFRPCYEINPDGIRHIGIVGQGRTGLEQKGAIFTLSRGP